MDGEALRNEKKKKKGGPLAYMAVMDRKALQIVFSPADQQRSALADPESPRSLMHPAIPPELSDAPPSPFRGRLEEQDTTDGAAAHVVAMNAADLAERLAEMDGSHGAETLAEASAQERLATHAPVTPATASTRAWERPSPVSDAGVQAELGHCAYAAVVPEGEDVPRRGRSPSYLEEAKRRAVEREAMTFGLRRSKDGIEPVECTTEPPPEAASDGSVRAELLRGDHVVTVLVAWFSAAWQPWCERHVGPASWARQRRWLCFAVAVVFWLAAVAAWRLGAEPVGWGRVVPAALAVVGAAAYLPWFSATAWWFSELDGSEKARAACVQPEASPARNCLRTLLVATALPPLVAVFLLPYGTMRLGYALLQWGVRPLVALALDWVLLPVRAAVACSCWATWERTAVS